MEEIHHLVPHSWFGYVFLSETDCLFVTGEEHGAGIRTPFAAT